MFKNDQELNTSLISDFEEIIDMTTKHIFELLRNSIENVVYGVGIPTVYPRYKDFGGLLGSFQKQDTEVNGQTIYGKIDQDPMSMVQHIPNDPNDFIHGSEFYDIKDVRELLTDWIINGKSGPKFGEGFWREPRNFWNPIMELFTNGTIDRYIESLMTWKGLKWIKI